MFALYLEAALFGVARSFRQADFNFDRWSCLEGKAYWETRLNLVSHAFIPSNYFFCLSQKICTTAKSAVRDYKSRLQLTDA